MSKAICQNPLTVAALALLALVALSQAPRLDVIYGYGPYDASIPKPESILGFGPGERHSTYRDMERTVLAIADAAKAKVRVFEYGKSNEGRPLRVLAISSAKNMARLEETRANIGKLANPDGKADNKDLIAKTPPIVWINECIHGDETASFESGMWLLYTLAASKNRAITEALDNAVMILNPVFNPDGHERYVVYYNDFAMGDPDPGSFEHAAPWIMRGRVNHYRFDMNRDHITLSQVETRTETAEFRRWNPQVYVDQHGQVSAYFFPPNPMSVNVNVDRTRLNKWTDIFGRATAKAFDKNGWLYMVKNEFDLYAPNYTDSWASLYGAIGMTHETDHGASIREARDDGSIATLKGAVEKHFISALTVFEASAARRTELLTDFLKYKQDAVSGKLAGRFQRVVVPMKGQSHTAVQRFLDILKRHGINSYSAAGGEALGNGHDFWSEKSESVTLQMGDLVIDMAQAQGPLAKALFEPQSDFEPEFIKEQQRRRAVAKAEEPDPDAGNYEFYDLTAWSLIYGCGVNAFWFESAAPIKKSSVDLIDWDPSDDWARFKWGREDGTGYYMPYDDSTKALFALKLASSGIRVNVADRELKAGKETIPAGSFLVLRDRNEDKLEERMNEALHTDAGWFKPMESAYPDTGRYGPGSSGLTSLKPPKVGVLFGDANSPTQFGHVWYVLEQELKVPFTAMTSNALNGDLRDYTCIIFPGGRGNLTPKLREWIQGGGCAVFLGPSQWAMGSSGLVTLETNKVDGKEPPGLPGSLFLGSLDARSFLAYGMPSADGKTVNVAVPVDGSTYYKAAGKGASVLTLPAKAEDVKLLSGWTWPDETNKALAGSVWAHVQDVGRGRAVFFMWDPTERAMYPSHWQLLLNAILFGPR